jgi:hypothetical protein
VAAAALVDPRRRRRRHLAVTSPFAALRWLDAWYQRTPEPTPDDLARLVRLRAAACAAIDEARRRLPS